MSRPESKKEQSIVFPEIVNLNSKDGNNKDLGTRYLQHFAATNTDYDSVHSSIIPRKTVRNSYEEFDTRYGKKQAKEISADATDDQTYPILDTNAMNRLHN